MIGIKPCDKCGYRHGYGRCCIDIYQQLGQSQGSSVVAKVFLAFFLPLLIFTACMILTERLLSGLMAEGILKPFLSFLTALLVTIIYVQLIRILTRKPISTKNNTNKKHE
jgi:uncharacterized membrane protein (DUF485 family)